MHTYRKTKDGDDYIYTVGFDASSGWVALDDFGDEDDARRLVNYLNGGDGKLFAYSKAE